MSDDRASLSGGHSYQEIGEYWDSHDAGDAWNETAPADFEVDLRTERHYYPVERSLAERISRAARTQGVSSETLINLWIQEKLAQSGS